MLVGRRLWSAAAALAAGASVLGLVGWKVVDEVLDLDGCDSENDNTIGVGSCASPLVSDDFAAGRATIDVYVRSSTSLGHRLAIATRTSRTKYGVSTGRRWPSSTPSGRVIPCWGDDSEVHYGLSPGSTVDVYGGCDVGDLVAGTHRLVYDGETVDTAHLGTVTD